MLTVASRRRGIGLGAAHPGRTVPSRRPQRSSPRWPGRHGAAAELSDQPTEAHVALNEAWAGLQATNLDA